MKEAWWRSGKECTYQGRQSGRKKAAGPPNCQTQLLDYRHQLMTVFEKMQEEEIKVLNTFVPHHWLLTVSPHLI